MPLAFVAPETRVEAVMPDTPTKPDALQAVNAAASNFHQSKKSAAARSVRVSMVRSQSTVTRQQLAVDSGDVDSMRQFVAEEAINAITNLNEAPTNFHQPGVCVHVECGGAMSSGPRVRLVVPNTGCCVPQSIQ